MNAAEVLIHQQAKQTIFLKDKAAAARRDIKEDLLRVQGGPVGTHVEVR